MLALQVASDPCSLAVCLLQVQLDREWYDQEEGGAQVDETHNPFLGDEALFAKKEAEMQQKMKRRDGSNMTLAQSKRANELQKDMNAWEENRMLTSGVVRMREVSTSDWASADTHASAETHANCDKHAYATYSPCTMAALYSPSSPWLLLSEQTLQQGCVAYGR